MDGTELGNTSRAGRGERAVHGDPFAPVRAKYVRITQTGTAEPPRQLVDPTATVVRIMGPDNGVKSTPCET